MFSVRYLLLLVLFSTSFILSVPAVYAESLSVSLQVGTTELNFQGYTSPGALVVIKENSSVISTTTTNSLGIFDQTISIAVPAVHTFELYAQDSSNLSTATVSYTLNVAGNTTTSITNIAMPPTVSLSNTTLNGSSYPGAALTLTSSLGDTASFTSGSGGSYSYDLSSLSYGTHTITLTSQIGSYLSVASSSLSFIHSAPTPTPSPTNTPLPSNSSIASPIASQEPIAPSLSPSLIPSPLPFFFSLYDSNHDGRLNLRELFGIVTNWLTRHLPCDLNHDQKCNLVDLSILLYYIER